LQYSWKHDSKRIVLVKQNGAEFFPSAEQVFECAFNGMSAIDNITIIGNPLEMLPGLRFSRYPAAPAIKVIGSSHQSLELKFGVIVNQEFVELEPDCDQIIIGNRWFPIDLESIEDGILWLESLGISSRGPVTIGQLISIRGTAASTFTLVDDADLSPTNLARDAAVGFTNIDGLDATLYPYQEDGAAFLELVADHVGGCILADEMGLGKTLQIIALMQSEKNAGRTPSLVVAPATLLENWRREIKQFAPRLEILVHSGASRAGIVERLTGYDVVVTSYDTAVRDEPLLSDQPWNLLILDEAQAIKNPNAQRTQAVKRIPRRVSIAVTGTPVENYLGDLWSISDFSLPGLLGSLESFSGQFEDELSDASRLGRLVTPILLRRLVSEVAQDLPEKIEILQPISASSDFAKLYENVRKETLAEYGASAGMVATTKLRVVCAHPSLSDNWHSEPEHEMPKYQRLLELLSEIFDSNEKVLVFTSFQGMTDLLTKDIPRRWPLGYFKHIDGRVPVSLRQSIVDEFFDHSGYGSLFLNPKAAGTGLNITTANHVIHYNPEWNPALTAQATARAYRRKQERPVTIHHLYFTDTVEEVMVDRAEFKRQLADGAVTGHSGDIDPSAMLRALTVSPTN
jgi:SNF2 family DNA or RNA helicase